MEFYILLFSSFLVVRNLYLVYLFMPLYHHLFNMNRRLRGGDILFVWITVITTIIFTLIIMNPSGIMSLDFIFIFNLNYYMYSVLMMKIIQKSKYRMGLGKCDYFHHKFGKIGYFLSSNRHP